MAIRHDQVSKAVMLLRFPFFLLRYSFLWIVVHCLGPLPDASQEGLLWPWKGYASVALFHYKVPEEATRATWEFASFQDQADCPSRQVHVWIQHGSYPVINASSTEEFPPHQYFVSDCKSGPFVPPEGEEIRCRPGRRRRHHLWQAKVRRLRGDGGWIQDQG